MDSNALILAATVAGLFVNTLAILGVAWRGGMLIGRMEGVLERVVAQLDSLERRVSALERPA